MLELDLIVETTRFDNTWQWSYDTQSGHFSFNDSDVLSTHTP